MRIFVNFSVAHIFQILEINNNIKNSFLEIIESTFWMNQLTRKEAIRKIKKIKTFISHESWVENPQEIENKYAQVSKYS